MTHRRPSRFVVVDLEAPVGVRDVIDTETGVRITRVYSVEE